MRVMMTMVKKKVEDKKTKKKRGRIVEYLNN